MPDLFIDTINNLAKLLVENAPQLRIAFNEVDRSRDRQPDAAHFLKFTLDGDERRMGRDIELYNFMSKVAGEQFVLVTLLEEWILPLKSYAPAAFVKGIDFLRRQPFNERQEGWNALLTEMSA